MDNYSTNLEINTMNDINKIKELENKIEQLESRIHSMHLTLEAIHPVFGQPMQMPLHQFNGPDPYFRSQSNVPRGNETMMRDPAWGRQFTSAWGGQHGFSESPMQPVFANQRVSAHAGNIVNQYDDNRISKLHIQLDDIVDGWMSNYHVMLTNSIYTVDHSIIKDSLMSFLKYNKDNVLVEHIDTLLSNVGIDFDVAHKWTGKGKYVLVLSTDMYPNMVERTHDVLIDEIFSETEMAEKIDNFADICSEKLSIDEDFYTSLLAKGAVIILIMLKLSRIRAEVTK